MRLGKPGLAMKKALAVHTHFEDFVEDQFDFHTYCMRKARIAVLTSHVMQAIYEISSS